MEIKGKRVGFVLTGSFCTFSKTIPKIKEIALNYDKKSFISVNDVTEVKGRGFKEKYL